MVVHTCARVGECQIYDASHAKAWLVSFLHFCGLDGTLNTVNRETARAFYNAAGVVGRNDPAAPESAFAVERVRPEFERIVRPGLRVLKIGCGAGRFCFAAEKMGAHVVGVDCAEVPLEYARRLATAKGSTSEFLLADVMELPIALGMFDVVLMMNNVVEFSWNDLHQIASQLVRMLQAGGTLCVSLPVKARRHATIGEDAVNVKMVRSRYEIPGKGIFDYHSYLWTVTLLKNALSPWMICSNHRVLADEMQWLEFVAVDQMGV